MNKLKLLVTLILLITNSNIFAQKGFPRLSPKSFVGQTIGYTNVEITYGSPGVKGRIVWDELVTFNKVWRTGANEATTIEFDKNVLIEGNKVLSGKYSLFSIPAKDSWTIILNKVYEQWGAFNYNREDDLIRFHVKPTTNHHVERLNFRIEYKSPYISSVTLEWEKIRVSFDVNSYVKK